MARFTILSYRETIVLNPNPAQSYRNSFPLPLWLRGSAEELRDQNEKQLFNIGVWI